MTFRGLSQFFAVLLVLLIASPITAPFAACDLAADVSPAQETFGSGAKAMTDATLLVPALLHNHFASFVLLADAVLASLDAGSSSLLTVLRL